MGSLFGVFLAFAASKITWPELVTEQKKIYPAVPTLCPIFTGASIGNCSTDDIYWQVFFVEFLASFVFIFSWLLIRNYEIYGEM